MTQDSWRHLPLIAFCGAANAGKSSLLNYFIKRNASITSPKPATTQKMLTFVREDAIFVDAAGTPIHDNEHKDSKRRGNMLTHDADVIILVIDASKKWRENTEHRSRKGKLYVALNKVDKVKDKSSLLRLAQKVQELLACDECFMLSAKTEQGCDKMEQALLQECGMTTTPKEFIPPPLTDEEMACEFTREALFHLLNEELPYDIYVRPLVFEVRDKNRLHIEQEILTSKKSRKGILIGKRGLMIKTIGCYARRRMRDYFNQKSDVFLSVRLVEKSVLHALQKGEER